MIEFNIWDAMTPTQQDEHGPRLQAYFPNTETIPDPEWVDLEDGTEAPQILKYTDKQRLDKAVNDILNRCSEKGQLIINKQGSVKIDPIE